MNIIKANYVNRLPNAVVHLADDSESEFTHISSKVIAHHLDLLGLLKMKIHQSLESLIE